jgi:threonine dehydrogenase-like Zn-dependent dehydrogenase
VIPLADSLPDEIAALAEPLGCVIKGLEDCRLSAGDSIVVAGDGPMGILAAAAARALGARPVIVSGMTPHRLNLARTHFADFVVDVSKEDLVVETKKATEGRGADIVLVAVSSGQVLADAMQCVRPGGIINAFAGVPDGTTLSVDVRWLHYKQTYLTGSFGTAPDHMQKALNLLDSGKIDGTAIVTKVFPFAQVEEAFAYSRERTGLKAVIKF